MALNTSSSDTKQLFDAEKKINRRRSMISFMSNSKYKAKDEKDANLLLQQNDIDMLVIGSDLSETNIKMLDLIKNIDDSIDEDTAEKNGFLSSKLSYRHD